MRLAVLPFLLTTTALCGQGWTKGSSRAPELHHVLHYIANATVVQHDTAALRTIALDRTGNAWSGTRVRWSGQGLPMVVAEYCAGNSCGTWFWLDSAGRVSSAGVYDGPDAMGMRYEYRTDGTLERSYPDCCPMELDLAWDRIFSGNAADGTYTDYDAHGRPHRIEHRQPKRREIWMFHGNGRPAFHEVKDYDSRIMVVEQWCPDGASVGRLKGHTDADGRWVVRGKLLYWNDEFKSHYRYVQKRRRSSLERLGGGQQHRFNSSAEAYQAMDRLRLREVQWTNGDALLSWPCRK
ncbi:MAG: hypothetical protein KF905_13600 [Flavobacteriales bacterium]|nr:hypothetical protein [Flavobacteriales bacterium]